MALDTYFQRAMKWCGNWSIGDSNNTSDLSVATTNLVSGQQDYGLDQKMLVIDSVWVKGQDGTFKKLTFEAGDYNTTKTGTPQKYTKTELSIIFDVIPDYSSTDAIQLFYRRTLPKFTATGNDTKTAGIPSVHEGYIARMASIPYLTENGKSSLAGVLRLVGSAERGNPLYGGDELDIMNFYAFRGRDERPKRMVANVENTK